MRPPTTGHHHYIGYRDRRGFTELEILDEVGPVGSFLDKKRTREHYRQALASGAFLASHLQYLA
jgi:ABC-type molybdenum transport system ATPase subunit/photorepair protein PhrA